MRLSTTSAIIGLEGMYLPDSIGAGYGLTGTSGGVGLLDALLSESGSALRAEDNTVLRKD